MARMKARGRAITALLAVMMVTALLPVMPAYAATTYTPSYVEAPRYVLNDHTPFRVRFAADAASGLLPNHTYYVKIRFSVSPTKPSGATNRGWTLNTETEWWEQERNEWLPCPTVTTGPSGEITSGSVYGKFGDEMSSGNYYLMISLSESGSDSTLNPVNPPLVTVLDAKAAGGWVHNHGAMASNSGGSRVAVRSVESTGDADGMSSVLYGLYDCELNGSDDDLNGIEDDEDYGLAGAVGDYRSAVPSNTVVDIYTKRTIRSNDFTTGPADCDIAVGAGENIPPAAVTGLTAANAGGAAQLAWNAGSDAGGSNLAGYEIYRWETLPAGTTPPYTPAPVRIAKVGAATTSYLDEDAITGVEYAYNVRAFDGDTNVGPRSNEATVTILGAGDVSRNAGDNRYQTALAISQSTFAAGSVDTTVVIATGRDYPDALAASGLAGVHGSPLLLVGTSLTAELKAEIDRLGATDVVLVGGTAAIPSAIETALKTSYAVKRVSGANRYATAANVAREIERFGGNTTEAYFVRGDGFADALAVSPFAYGMATPVLLVQTNNVPADTAAAIDDLGVSYGMIAGGASAVSVDVEDDLETLTGAPLDRWAGVNRYATAALVADAHVADMFADYGYVGIATGTNFADALGGGAAAGYNGGVLLLTAPASLSSETGALLTANKNGIDEVHVFGGAGAVGPAVYNQITAILQ